MQLYRHDVEEIVVRQCIEYALDGLFRDLEPLPQHRARHIQHDQHIFGHCRGIDKPTKIQFSYSFTIRSFYNRTCPVRWLCCPTSMEQLKFLRIKTAIKIDDQFRAIKI